MKTLLMLSWRNIWRHPARSGVLLAAIAAGLWAGVFTIGIINGLMVQRVSYLIESEITHAQIHHPEFRAEGYSRLYIPDHEAIAEWLDNDPRVHSFTMRTLTDGMVRSPVKSAGVRIRGINTETETRTTTFHENLIEGEYLDSNMRNAVIVGEKFVEEHNLELGNRIVLTFENIENELVSGSFNIAGIFRSASVDFDERNLFIRSDDFIQLLSDRELYHEIAIMLLDEELAVPFVEELNAEFEGITAQSWREISPELTMIIEMGGVMVILITAIIMIALAFGILNTMLMALFERMREIGMLISIGMSRARVFVMIMMEAIILTVAGAATGIILALLTINHYSESGLNMEMFADGAAQLGWDHVVFPILTTTEFIVIITVVVVITLCSTIYPAFKGVRINPLEAARDA